MHWKYFLSVILIFLIQVNLSAQKADKTPDEIIRTNGKVVECRITSIDSIKIDLVHYSQGQEIKSFLYLDGVSSYTYKGEKVFLRELEETYKFPETYVEEETKVKKTRIDTLHVGGQPYFVAKLSLIMPGLEAEFQLASNVTLLVGVWTGFAYTKTSINDATTETFDLVPQIMVAPRFYTTLNSRAARGKRVDYYSSMYMGTPAIVTFYKGYKIFSLGEIAGFQRTIGRKGYWNIGFGFGIYVVDETIGFSPMGELRLGVILSK